ncbi:hypothetical protein N806_11190 [Rhodococcus sp. P27]|nr:hypothetical protein N806_11190 [Rhodococcus sp. P27]
MIADGLRIGDMQGPASRRSTSVDSDRASATIARSPEGEPDDRRGYVFGRHRDR